jgi:hypothetical protein
VVDELRLGTRSDFGRSGAGSRHFSTDLSRSRGNNDAGGPRRSVNACRADPRGSHGPNLANGNANSGATHHPADAQHAGTCLNRHGIDGVAIRRRLPAPKKTHLRVISIVPGRAKRAPSDRPHALEAGSARGTNVEFVSLRAQLGIYSSSSLNPTILQRNLRTMIMRNNLAIGAAATSSALLFLITGTVLANSMPARRTLPEMVAAADCIVIGKVAEIEESLVNAPPFPGATIKIDYRIANVKIEDGLHGGKGLTHVRIAFQPPPPAPKPVKPGPGPIAIGPRPFPRATLEVGNEGCFLLRKQGDEAFYRLVDSNYNDFIAKSTADFDKKVALVKQSLKILANPDAGLKAKDSADRLLTAYLLLRRFEASAGRNAKTVSVDAAQSKLVLEAIAGADWNKVETGDVTPRGVFALLRLTPKDGWNAPRQGPMQDIRLFMKDWDAAAQKWLKDNSSTHRLQRWVAEK